MIDHFTDNDAYKFAMQNAVLKKYPRANVVYEFTDRDNREYPDGFGDELYRHIKEMRGLSLTKDEYDFFREKSPHLDQGYLDFLKGYRYDPSEVHIVQQGPKLSQTIKGKWYRTILWEVPELALTSELYHSMTEDRSNIGPDRFAKERIKMRIKAERLCSIGAPYSDFGTRRRFSYTIQDEMNRILKEYGGSNFMGTSNVHFAMKYNTTPIGTMAHEWIMFHGALFGYLSANPMAMKAWVDVYQGDVGIALPDTFTTNMFLKDFGLYLTKLFDGTRQDSGVPTEYAQKLINKYISLKINPLSKTIVFSDSLNVDKVESIHNFCKGNINDAYGIGTHLTNDLEGIKPPNIVIKLQECQRDDNDCWVPCVKISDDYGKNMGLRRAVVNCIETINLAIIKEIY